MPKTVRGLFVACALLLLGSGTAMAQTLVYGSANLPVNLDLPQDLGSLTVRYQIAEPLVLYEPGTTTIKPGLATSWEANEDSTVWTFHLRQGVSFQDGTPFDAAAVKFNFDRWNNRDDPNAFPESKNFVAWTFIFSAFHGEPGYLLESVDVIDPATVSFTLTSPVGFFPTLLSSSYFGIDSPTAINAAGEAYGTPAVGAVGTGPFSFVEWLEGDHVTLQRNDAYWGEPAKLDRIVFQAIENAPTRLAQLEAGSIDIAVSLSPDDLDVVLSNPDLVQATGGPELTLGYIGIDQRNPPFEDVRVRQAFAYAIDKEAIVDAFYGSLGDVAAEFIPPGLIGRAELEPYPYDPEKARELLAEAGYPDGFSTEFWYMPVSRPYFPTPKDIAEAVAGYLADVGIDVQLNTEDWGLYLADTDTAKFPLSMSGWFADYPDPNNFINTFFGTTRTEEGYGWDDAYSKEVGELLSEAARASDQDERVALYQQASRIVYEQMPALPFVNPRSLNATRANIHGFIPNAMGTVVSLAGVTKD